MSIYIARGDDTLGPYNVSEAAELLQRGDLRTDDLAARNGDAAWVPLSTLISLETSRTIKPKTGDVPAGPEARRAVGTGLFIGLAVLLVVVGALMAQLRPARVPSPPLVRRPASALARSPAKPLPTPAQPPPTPVPVAVVPQNPPSPFALPSAAPESARPVAASPPATAPPLKKDCRLTGTVSFGSPGSEPTRFADVRVEAYALTSLLPLLAAKDACVQGELARLAPQLQVAEAEKTRRVSMLREAQQTYLNSSPSNPLRSSLRFAVGQARTDASTAMADYQYLLDEHDDVMEADFYFRDLPKPTAEAQTDADGRFALDLPTGGPYALAARVRQTGLGDTRIHYWLVKFVLEDGSRKSLLLSNDNVTSAGSADSLIHSAY